MAKNKEVLKKRYAEVGFKDISFSIDHCEPEPGEEEERDDLADINFDDLKKRSVPMHYPDKTYQVFLGINSYAFGGGLYIGLYRVEEEDGTEPYIEDVADLTVNLPGGYSLEKNEAFISHNFSKEKLSFIKEQRLGKPTGVVAHNGFAEFTQVAFDLDRLKEMDPEGFARWEEH